MSRKVVKIDLTQPYHPYQKDGEKRLASPTVDSLLKSRSRKQKAKATGKTRVVIRHKREF